MSEIVVAVLSMPDELFWSDAPLTRMQHNNIRKEAARELAALKEENERLKAEIAKGPRFEWPEPIVIYDADDEPKNYYRPSQIAEALDKAGITDRVQKS